jgi:SAM-dependent methyltransferase
MPDHAQPTPPFDESLAARKRLAALAQSPSGNFLMRHLAAELVDRLATVNRRFSSIVTLFSPDPQIASALAHGHPDAAITLVDDWAALPAKGRPEEDGLRRVQAVPGLFAGAADNADLVISMLAMQSVNDLPGFLIQARRMMRPDGMFIGCLLGTGSLHELRDTLISTESELKGGVSPRVAPFADVRDLGALLQRAGFALPVADADTLTLRHDSLIALVRDLRALGLTNALAGRSRTPLSAAFWNQAATRHAERFAAADGRIPATLNIIWLSGWAPAPSQRKPLKPGSAAVSLKDVL